MKLTAFVVAALALGAVVWVVMRKGGLLAQYRAKRQAGYNAVALQTAQQAVAEEEFKSAFRGRPPGQ